MYERIFKTDSRGVTGHLVHLQEEFILCHNATLSHSVPCTLHPLRYQIVVDCFCKFLVNRIHNLLKKITDKSQGLKAIEFDTFRNTDIVKMVRWRSSSLSSSNGNNHRVKHEVYITITNIPKLSGETN